MSDPYAEAAGFANQPAAAPPKLNAGGSDPYAVAAGFPDAGQRAPKQDGMAPLDATFNVRDPAALRARIAAGGDTALLQRFDQMVPGYDGTRQVGGGRGFVNDTGAMSRAPARSAVGNAMHSLGDAAGGLIETIDNGALGTVAALGGGLATVGGLLTGSTDRAEAWNDWAKRNISTVAGLHDPTPNTETGKGIQDALSWVGDKVKQGAQYVGEKTLGVTGSPLAATVADVGTQAAAQVGAALVGNRLAGGNVRGGVAGDSQAVQAAVDQGRGVTAQPVPAEGMGRQVSGGGAAVSSSNPFPTLTGEQSVRGGDFRQVKLSQVGASVPASEQTIRSAVIGKILDEASPGSSERMRPGPVTGSEDTLRTEYALAKASDPTPEGILLRDKMAEEQRALHKFADKIVESTGASQTLLSDEARGNLLNSALYGPESLRAHLQDLKGQIYDEAARRQGPNPVDLPSLDKMVNSPQLSSSLKIAGLPNMLPGVQELLQQFRTNGFENPVTGELIPPNTVAAAMELHKALNTAWTPENSGYIGRMKRSILNDVAQVGGADLYQAGNAIHAAEQNLMTAPGVKTIFGEVDPNTGISKGRSPEKILSSINSLPVDQYRHIYDLFDNMRKGRVPGASNLQLPDALQQAGAQAVREMAGSITRDIQSKGAGDKGEWNANKANKALNAYTEKLNIAAPPDVIRNLHVLDVGGQWLPGPLSYEGAIQQGRRMSNAGLLENNAQRIGVGVGGTIGNLLGVPVIGEVSGLAAGKAAQEALATRRLFKRAEATDAAMEAAAKSGKSLKDIMQ